MNAASEIEPPILNPAPAQTVTLRRLFLTLYLRGRSSRGIKLKSAPKSVWQKLTLALLVYTCFGCISFSFVSRSVFALAIFIHSMTFVFLAMFVSSSAGEVLFNKEEADILMHRPVTSRDLLWSKIRMLIQISLWLAGALNLISLFVGTTTSDGGILFPFVHVLSTILEALFCAGCIVLVYQLCLRWLGRERLDGLMTTVQVFFAIAAVGAGQILPRLMFRLDSNGSLKFGPEKWWLGFFPPAWFAGLDNAVAAHGGGSSWLLAGIGVVATAIVLWIAFGKLAHVYETGLQSMAETVSRPRPVGKRRWTEIIATVPPVKWFSPVSRTGFLLTLAYLFRDRDTKLRVFPGVAPMLILPFVFLVQDRHVAEGFGFGFSAGFLACLPLIALDLLQYSQQWQASDIFRVAPMVGPAELCHGARRAVICVLAFPAFVLVAFILWVIHRDVTHLVPFLPGLILMPLVAVVPSLLRRGIPLSFPNEEAKSAGRSLKMFCVMVPAAALSVVASMALKHGWIGWMLLAEIAIVVPLYYLLRMLINKLRWQPVD